MTTDPLAPDEEGLVPPYVDSDLLKGMRAADGCDAFAFRVQGACLMNGIPYTDDLRRAVAFQPDVLAGIRVDKNSTVSTVRVTDTAILNAVETQRPQEPHPID